MKFLPLLPTGRPGLTSHPKSAGDCLPLISPVKYNKRKGEIEIAYEFPWVIICDSTWPHDPDKKYKRVWIPEAGHLAQEFKPMLPSFARYVEVPFKSKCTVKYEKFHSNNITELTKKHGCLEDALLVLPFTYPWSVLPPNRELNRDGYAMMGKSESYPDPDTGIVDTVGPFAVDGRNGLLVRVRPVSYNPEDQSLIGYGKIVVTISLEFDPDLRDGRLKAADLEKGAFCNFFINPVEAGESIEEKVGFPMPEKMDYPHFSTGFRERDRPEMVVFYKSGFEEYAKHLAHWKNRRGLITETIHVSGPNDVRKVAFIREKVMDFAKEKLGYVLLLGDAESIPPSAMIPDDWAHPAEDVPTDYYYSTWDEPSGSVPKDPRFFNPFCAVGRIAVREPGHAKAIVENIINYEKKPPEINEYYKRMDFITHFEDKKPPDDPDGTDESCNIQTMEEIRKALTEVPSIGVFLDTNRTVYDVTRIYVCNPENPGSGYETKFYRYDQTEVPDEIKDSMIYDYDRAVNLVEKGWKEGRLVMAYKGHGMYNMWCHPQIRDEDLKHHTPSNPTVIYSNACQTGRFHFPDPYLGFATRLLLEKKIPSAIAPTGSTLIWPPVDDELIRGLFDASWSKRGLISSFPADQRKYDLRYNRLGDILHYAKDYLKFLRDNHIQTYGEEFNDEEITKYYLMYHVIGDPSLELWKNPPVTEDDVDVDPFRATPDKLQVILRPCPPDTYLTLWKTGNGFIETQYLGKSGSSSERVLFSNLGPEEYRLSFWAAGHRYQEKTVARCK